MSLYKETLMNHFRNPQYKIENTSADISIDGVNPSCGDNITIYMNKNENIIDYISYTGNGCAISMASADILCEIIKGRDDSKKVITDFISMVNGDTDIVFNIELSKLEVFKELQKYPARRSCAILPWKTLLSAL